MAEVKNLLVTLEILKAKHDHDNRVMKELEDKIKAGTEATAEWHLGFYLDENGDLCQKEE